MAPFGMLIGSKRRPSWLSWILAKRSVRVGCILFVIGAFGYQAFHQLNQPIYGGMYDEVDSWQVAADGQVQSLAAWFGLAKELTPLATKQAIERLTKVQVPLSALRSGMRVKVYTPQNMGINGQSWKNAQVVAAFDTSGSGDFSGFPDIRVYLHAMGGPDLASNFEWRCEPDAGVCHTWAVCLGLPDSAVRESDRPRLTAWMSASPKSTPRLSRLCPGKP